MITFSDAKWDTLGGHDHDQRRLLGFGLMLGWIALFKIFGRPSQLVERAARLLGLGSYPVERLLKLRTRREIFQRIGAERRNASAPSGDGSSDDGNVRLSPLEDSPYA